MLMCCLSCAKVDWCKQADRVEDFCINHEERTLTNADRIRQMTDEELADFIGTHDCLDCPLNNEDDWCAGQAGSCRGNVLEWLKSTVEEGET